MPVQTTKKFYVQKMNSDYRNDKFVILEKPDWITYEDIYHALWEPIKTKRKCEAFTRDLKGAIGEYGVCFVALYGNKIVGTLSVSPRVRDVWYAHGKVAFYMYARVAPEWQGHHINSMLTKKTVEYSIARDISIIELQVSASNKHAIQVYRQHGFQIVSLSRPKHQGVLLAMVRYLKKEQHGFRIRLYGLIIGLLLPFYRAARNIYCTFRDKIVSIQRKS